MSPQATVRARGRRPQKTVRRAPPTICTGRRGGRPAGASAFCRGNTGCWVCLGAVCLPSGRRGPPGLYLGSLCWRSGTASLTRAAGRKQATRHQHGGPGPARCDPAGGSRNGGALTSLPGQRQCRGVNAKTFTVFLGEVWRLTEHRPAFSAECVGREPWRDGPSGQWYRMLNGVTEKLGDTQVCRQPRGPTAGSPFPAITCHFNCHC